MMISHFNIEVQEDIIEVRKDTVREERPLPTLMAGGQKTIKIPLR